MSHLVLLLLACDDGSRPLGDFQCAEPSGPVAPLTLRFTDLPEGSVGDVLIRVYQDGAQDAAASCVLGGVFPTTADLVLDRPDEPGASYYLDADLDVDGDGDIGGCRDAYALVFDPGSVVDLSFAANCP